MTYLLFIATTKQMTAMFSAVAGTFEVNMVIDRRNEEKNQMKKMEMMNKIYTKGYSNTRHTSKE